MNFIQFPRYSSFQIELSGWGEAIINDIIALLENVTDTFYSELDYSKIPTKSVQILNSINHTPPLNHPRIYRGSDIDTMYLNVKDNYWSKFSYQFSHELCHHVIDADFVNSNDRFGWLEETLCELTSIFCIDKMSETWKTSPPYLNWADYSSSLKEYVNEILNRGSNKINTEFSVWLSENIEELYNNRCLRTENTLIATHLFPFFKSEPTLWQAIHYMKFIGVTDSMDIITFFNCWIELTPEHLKGLLNEVKFYVTGER